MNQPHPARSILVVDDDEAIRSIVEICLRRAGHKVVGACGRSRVLALLQGQPFDLVITDVLMPDLDGSEVIRAVHLHQPGTAILAMSGDWSCRASELLLDIAMTGGVGPPLMKPFHMHELMRAVDQALNAKGAPNVLTH